MLAILGSTIFSVGYGLSFSPQTLTTTGFSVTVNVSTEETTVVVVGPADKWLAVGFGGLTMSDGTSASLFTGTDTLETRYFDSYGLGDVLGDFWTVLAYAEANGTVSYTMIRKNNINDICSQCYVFDSRDEPLNIIMAMGPFLTFETVADKHDERSGYTLLTSTTVSPTTATPTTEPISSDPTTSPAPTTEAPTSADSGNTPAPTTRECATGGIYGQLPNGVEVPYSPFGLCLRTTDASGNNIASVKTECRLRDTAAQYLYASADCSGDATSSLPLNMSDVPGGMTRCDESNAPGYARISVSVLDDFGSCSGGSFENAIFVGVCAGNGTVSTTTECTDSSLTTSFYESGDCSGEAVFETDILANSNAGCGAASVVECYMTACDGGSSAGSSAGFKIEVGLVMVAVLFSFLWV